MRQLLLLIWWIYPVLGVNHEELALSINYILDQENPQCVVLSNGRMPNSSDVFFCLFTRSKLTLTSYCSWYYVYEKMFQSWDIRK